MRRNPRIIASFWIVCLTFIELLMALPLTASAATGTPWFHDAQLEWYQFTPLADARGTNEPTSFWKFIEVERDGLHKLYALRTPWAGQQQLLVSDSTIAPVFTEVPVNWSDVGVILSMAVSKWEKAYKELFISSRTGVRRFDEGLGQFAPVWIDSFCGNNVCDPFYLASLGDSLIVAVGNWGAGSGDWLVTTNGRTRLSNCCGSQYLWADEVSRRHDSTVGFIRTIADGRSLLLRGNLGPGGAYSFDGGITDLSPIGVRNDGQPLYVGGYYEYSNTNIVVFGMYYLNSVFIGNVGETLYSLKCPVDILSSFFYSPTSRLLIVGDDNSTNMYYTVLPPANQVLPELSIQNAVIVSWSTQYLTAILQGSTSPTGEWQVVDAPRQVVGDQVQVAIPTDTPSRYFRMVLVP